MVAQPRLILAAIAIGVAACASLSGTVDPKVRESLAPTGKLRLAFISPAFVYSVKDPATGEFKGLAPDIGKDVAQRVGAPLELVTYGNPPAMVEAGKANQWDIVMMGISAERAAVIDFSSPFIIAQSGYLVRKDFPAATMADVDRPGVRIGVFAKSSVDNQLTGLIKQATLVRAPSVSALYTMLASGKADVIAAAKTGLYSEAAKNPGSRVLDGSFLDEPIAMGVPKGRDARAAAFVNRYVEEAKADGRIQAAVDRAGLRGVVVPR
jgi:polar amino acid transport system substrate-binding protein